MRIATPTLLASLLLAGVSSYAESVELPDRGLERAFDVVAPTNGEVVLYERGLPRSDLTRRLVTPRFAVKLKRGVAAADVAADYGLAVAGHAAGLPAWTVLTAGDARSALGKARTLRNDPRVEAAHLQLRRQAVKRLLPNDTFFTNQWHLRNTLAVSPPGLDANVTNVWDSYRGTGVVIGIVDDGLQTAHPDLSPNVNTNIDYDWNDGTPLDPSPNLSDDDHGTACAGVAAARGNNGIGVSGSAPEATLVGLRLIAASVTDEQEAEAILHSNSLIHIKSNSWGPTDGGGLLAGPGPITIDAMSNACMTGRGGRGTVLVFAGGNGRDLDDNVNLDGYANSPYVIAVGAVAEDGTFSYYSDPGSCLIVCAPSDNHSTNHAITTTDRTGSDGYNTSGAGDLPDTSYTKTFGGTSSAAPLVSGVIALILQANTNLGWRDVQEILIRSSRKIDLPGGSWRTNSAGFSFSHDYGAGLIDARAAVTMAQSWTNLGAWVAAREVQTNLSVAIPDASTTGVTRTFFLSGSQRVERVAVEVDITHLVRRQLEIELTSPSGMTSTLIDRKPRLGADFPAWTFTSVRHWGESMSGTWTLRVSDVVSGFTGTLHGAKLTVHGTATTSNSPPILNTIGDALTEVSNLLQFAVTAIPTEADPVTLVVSNAPAGSSFATTNETGTFSFLPTDAQVGVYTTTIYAVDNDGADMETILITVVPRPDGGGTKVLVYYDFDNGGATLVKTPEFVAPRLSASTAEAVAGFVTNYAGNPSTGRALGGTGWTGTGSHVTFTVSVSNGFEATLTGMRFDDQKSSSGPTNWLLRHSGDAYGLALGNGTTHTSFATNELGFMLGPLTGSVTFRIHGEGASTNSGTWRVDNLRLLGFVNPADSDGDGVIDLHEWVAGTDPHDAESFLAASSTTRMTNGIEVTWRSESNRVYTLSVATNLPGPFAPLVTTLPATPPVNTYLDLAATNGVQFYRVDVEN